MDESFIVADHNLILASMKQEPAVGAAAGIQSCNGNTLTLGGSGCSSLKYELVPNAAPRTFCLSRPIRVYDIMYEHKLL